MFVNLHMGTTNDENDWIRGTLSPDYFLTIDGDLVNVKYIIALQKQFSSISVDYVPKEDSKVLFRCRGRFRVGREEKCGDESWLEGQILKIQGDEAEILAANCDHRRATTFHVVTEPVENILAFDNIASSWSSRYSFSRVLHEICANETEPTAILVQEQPPCKLFKFKQAYPGQSSVIVTTNSTNTQDFQLRTDIKYHMSPTSCRRWINYEENRWL